VVLAFWGCFSAAAAAARWRAVFGPASSAGSDGSDGSGGGGGKLTAAAESAQAAAPIAEPADVVLAALPHPPVAAGRRASLVAPAQANAEVVGEQQLFVPPPARSTRGARRASGHAPPAPGGTPALQTLAEAEAALPARAAIASWRAGEGAPAAYAPPAARPPTPTWLRVHASFVVLGLALATAGVVAIEQALRRGAPSSTAPRPRDWGSHQRAGAVALVAVLAQALLGAFRPHPGPGRVRAVWLAAHRAVAAVALLAAVAAVGAARTTSARCASALA